MHPDAGRFVSQDPIGLAGGPNLYQYAPNPLGGIDPLGLSAHRGRIQAQGASLEESVSWNQDTPLTAEMGYKMINLALRGTKPLTPDLESFANHAIEGLNKIPAFDGETFRGIDSLTSK